ncbi:hypothetical protein [Microbulbifer sp. YPW16]|uniref:hypothetical protein n=1 Tax=unclassified Microbulbifer TaxID=2619833 RepID=UPI001E599FFE|nr:hypothetical protein [Microbulbifer sp. YPW16]UHQ54161.1 hypothetical protein LVE68_11600 [Microbulbifer sp. YPW16]
MWYKRYGYKHPASNSEIGFFSGLAVTLAASGFACALVAIFDSYWFLLVAVPVAVAGFELLARRTAKDRNAMRDERHRYHIDQAYAYIEAGHKEAALEAIRRARIYGELPAGLQAFEKERRAHQRA